MADEKTMQPWTPGKLEVRDRLGRIYVTDPDGIVIAQITSGNHADARLFVAAPPMAEALALFVQCLDASRDPTTNPLRLALDRDRCEKSARAALDACGWRWS
jgi:hypothetical protein